MGQKYNTLILYFLILLSVVAAAASVHLVKTHYDESNAPGFCGGTGGLVDCATVNTSQYSEFLNVPVSGFGFIWAGLVGATAIVGLRRRKNVAPLVLLWGTIGSIIALYFIWAEIQLGALCTFCTILHGIAFSVLGLGLFMVSRLDEKPSLRNFIKIATPWIISAVIVTTIPFIYFNI